MDERKHKCAKTMGICQQSKSDMHGLRRGLENSVDVLYPTPPNPQTVLTFIHCSVHCMLLGIPSGGKLELASSHLCWSWEPPVSMFQKPGWLGLKAEEALGNVSLKQAGEKPLDHLLGDGL